MSAEEPTSGVGREVPRRQFLSTAAGGAAAALVAPAITIASPWAKGANERIGVGFIGITSYTPLDGNALSNPKQTPLNPPTGSER